MSDCQECADRDRELTEVRKSYRRFKETVLHALGLTGAWDVTVITEESIRQRIAYAVAHQERRTIEPVPDSEGK